jgi:hypothetical protein
VEDGSSQFMTVFAFIQLLEDAASFGRIVDVSERMNRFVDAAQLGHGLRQPGRAIANLEHSHDGGGLNHAQLEGSRQSQQVIPVLLNAFGLDPVTGDRVEWPVVGGGVHPPVARPADVGDSRAEAITQQPKQAKHHVGIGPGVRHDLTGVQFRGLFEHQG